MNDRDRESAEPPNFYLGGIQVHEAELDGWLDALSSQSMNTVHVTEYARQGDWDSDDLEWHPVDGRIVEEIRAAEDRGFGVVYICRVHLENDLPRNEFLWHGMILPGSDELLASWFEKYRDFVVDRAAMAQREGVDVFVIGSELNALATTIPTEQPPGLEEYFLNEEKQRHRKSQVLAEEGRLGEEHRRAAEQEGFESVEGYIDARIEAERRWAEGTTGGDAGSLEAINADRARLADHWRALIEDVRAVFSGRVGYAANFDHYQQVGFWQSLDVMGINAYFSLRDQVFEQETEETLYPMFLESWGGVLRTIGEYRRGQGLEHMPLIFTEMGYTRRARSTIQPWADDGFALIYGTGTRADGTPGESKEYVIVWREQPIRLEERAWAVRALHRAHEELDRPFLKGILYWKLSSHDYHFEDEAFVVHVGDGSEDPVLPELRRFVGGSGRLPKP